MRRARERGRGEGREKKKQRVLREVRSASLWDK
jgi:hypothetical protein